MVTASGAVSLAWSHFMMLTQQSAFRVKCGWLLRGVWWPWQDTILALTLCFEGGRSYPVYLVLMSQLQSWILKCEITFQKIKKKKKKITKCFSFKSSSHWIDCSCCEGSLRTREECAQDILEYLLQLQCKVHLDIPAAFLVSKFSFTVYFIYIYRSEF